MSRLRRLLERQMDRSAIWRSLSPRDPQHLGMLAGSLLTGAAVAWQAGGPAAGIDAATAGALGALTVFAAWALARELDPDRTGSALLAGGLGAALAAAGRSGSLAVVAVLLGVRIVVRSTGRAPTGIDLALLPVLAAVVAWFEGGWAGGLLLAAGMLWDTALEEDARLPQRLAALAAGAAAILVGAARGWIGPGPQPPEVLDWAVGVLVVASALALRPYQPTSPTDRGSGPIPAARLAAGRLLAVAAIPAAALALGGPAVAVFSSLWAALVAVAVYSRLVPRSAT